MADLAGRVAMVTGGTRGIGLATVRALAAWGATVVLTGRDPETATIRAAAVAADVEAEVAGIGLDVNDEDAVQAAFRRTAKRYGRIDALVAAAGTLEAAPIGMMTSEHVERMMATNVSGTLATLRAATQVMVRKRSGSIVLFGSIAGEHGAVGQTAYAAAKSAVAGAARSAARELGRYGIRVNAVAPGVIRTDLTAGQSDEVLEGVLRRTPLGRLGEPADVARVVRFLVSDEAAFVTGQVLGVDGGLVL
jgi:3-oxoacyl-[acyl-carrier protein] reductase